MTRRLYNLEPRDTTGVFLGLSTGELALIGTGFLVAVMARLSGAPALVAGAPLLVGVALAKGRLGGRPVREWAPLLVGWAANGVAGRRRWNAPLPLFPSDQAVELPPVLAGLEIIEVPGPGRNLAAVCDRRAGRLTVVLVVEGGQFACQDPAAQDVLLASWGEVLAGHATTGSPVVQIGWCDVATHSGLADHRRWADSQLDDPTRAVVGDPAGYQSLVEEMAGLATVHETVVWLTVSGSRVRGGHGKPLDRAIDHLPTAVDNLTAALGNAGLRTGGPLPVAGLWRLLRSRIDPADHTTRGGGGGSLAERLGLVGPANGGPLAISTAWSQTRMDASFHRTWWVEAWPRRPVPGDWLQGFLAAGESRAMAVAYRPIDPERSRKRIESQMIKHSANRAIKAERDRRVTETDRRAEEAVGELEAELASGYAEMLYLGLVTVSAPTIDELDAAGRRVEQAARAQGMSLRVLHGRQDVAWAAALPFGLADPSVLDLVGV